MVNQEAQLYTIEGVAASILVLTTVYLVLSTTTVFTPGETHIYDMQLEQLGNDVLAVIDVNATYVDPEQPYPKSPLERYVQNPDPTGFDHDFLELCNNLTGNRRDTISYNASIVYRNETTGSVAGVNFAGSEYHRENAVKVTRWVNIDNSAGNWTLMDPRMDRRIQTVLLEVLLWRG